MTEEEKKPQEVSQKHGRYLLWEILFVALVAVVVFGTPLAIYWWNSSVIADYDSDRVINIIARNDILDNTGRWLVQEGNGWNYRDVTAPSEIRVKQGEKVTLRIASFDVLHGFKLEGYGIESTQIYSGKVVEITFVADKAGRFPFKCTIACGVGHSDMVGELIVEPSS